MRRFSLAANQEKRFLDSHFWLDLCRVLPVGLYLFDIRDALVYFPYGNFRQMTFKSAVLLLALSISPLVSLVTAQDCSKNQGFGSYGGNGTRYSSSCYEGICNW